ncbi:pro1 protein [Moniliophthora roreri]|nr:pro1 protein [Moniliophthora roreri]
MASPLKTIQFVSSDSEGPFNAYFEMGNSKFISRVGWAVISSKARAQEKHSMLIGWSVDKLLCSRYGSNIIGCVLEPPPNSSIYATPWTLRPSRVG